MERNYMAVNLKTLKLGGLWDSFEQSRFQHLKLRLYSVYTSSVVVAMLIHVVTQTIDLFVQIDDLENLAANGQVALTFLPATLKLLCFLQRREKIRQLVAVLRSGGFSRNLRWSKEHDRIVDRANFYTRILSWSYYIFGIATVSSFVIGALSSSYQEIYGVRNSNGTSPKRLINGAWYPFDIQKPSYYCIAFAFQTLVNAVGPTINIGMDAFIVSLLVHSCGQFRLLKYSLKTIKDRVHQVTLSNTRYKDNSDKRNAELHILSQRGEYLQEIYGNTEEVIDLRNGPAEAVAMESLKECIEHHQILLKFLDDIQDIFGPIFLCQFFFSSCSICLSIFSVSVSLNTGAMDSFASSLQFFLLSTMQLLLYCWYGNELTYESDSVTAAMYETPWYETSPGFSRCLVTMMCRTTHICVLNAGFLNKISLETFTNIMKASFSYYTILNERSNA